MECVACTRSDTTRSYYCSNCIKSRLLEHQQRKSQLRNQLCLATNRSNSLLENGRLGVRQESRLKADRWTTSVKLRDTRIATEQEKSTVDNLSSSLAERRSLLQSRRSNLSTAKSLLTSLTTSSNSPLPDSLSSLSYSLSTLSHSLSSLSSQLYKTRRILTLELLSVFSFKILETPCPDPFILPHHHQQQSPSPFHEPIYSISNLPLPNLSLLSTLPPNTLEALLGNLSHLTKLIALYEQVSLPFSPSLSAGRIGIRANPGWGLDESESEAGVESWPLGFGSNGKGSSKDGRGQDESEEEEEEEGGSEQRERRGGNSEVSRIKRLKLVLIGAMAIAFDLAYITWVRERSTEVEGTRGRSWKVEDLDDLGKLVRIAAGDQKVNSQEEEHKHDSSTPLTATHEDLDPFPSLSSPSSSSAATIHPPPTSLPSPASFPLSFPLVVEHYLSLSFPKPNKRSSKKKGSRGETIGRGKGMGQSSFVDASRDMGDEEDQDEGEGEEEEEWDFV